MDQLEEFVDERQKSWCIHCGAWIATSKTNRDHVPSKSLLRKPYPENLPVVEICKTCNEGFSLDEEYLVAFLGAVLAGSTDPDAQTTPKAADILRRNERLRSRIEASKSSYQTIGGETRVVWKPEWERVHRVIVKNARGHAFFEIGEPMLRDPTHVGVLPFEALSGEQRNEFEAVDFPGFWPEVGSRMMTRILTGQDLDGPWVVVQEGVYRYAVMQTGGMLVRMVLSEYLAAEVIWDE